LERDSWAVFMMEWHLASESGLVGQFLAVATALMYSGLTGGVLQSLMFLMRPTILCGFRTKLYGAQLWIGRMARPLVVRSRR
jgi:hypothetical protein